MSSYKRATLEEEEGSDTPAEAASSPDRMEVSKRTAHTDTSFSLLFPLLLSVSPSSLMPLALSSEVVPPSRPADSGRGLCLSEGCVTVASQIVEAMDRSADPCQDFYQFACGGWMRKNPLPDGRSRWSTFNSIWEQNQALLKHLLENGTFNGTSEAERKTQSYYLSCLNTQRIEELGSQPLIDLITKVTIGGWNMTGPWDKDNFMEVLKMVSGPYRAQPFFSVGVSTDPKSSNSNVIQVDQSGLFLPSRDYYLNKTANEKVLAAYLDYMVELGMLLGGEKSATQLQMQQILDFETALANITVPQDQRRDEEKIYHKVTIAELQLLAPAVDWLDFLTFSLAPLDLNDTEPVVLYAREYLQQVSELINKTDRSLLNNYMMWTLVQKGVATLDQRFENAQDKLLESLYGTKKVRLLPPALPAPVPEHSSPADGRVFSRWSQAFLLNICLDQIWRTGIGPPIPPHANVYSLIHAGQDELPFKSNIYVAPEYKSQDRLIEKSDFYSGESSARLRPSSCPSGREYDKEGNLRPWWQNSSVEAFRHRTECMVDQYNHYIVNGEPINGKQTLGENIADNGGLKAAYHAYRSWIQKNGEEKRLPAVNLTNDQLFFLGFAQVSSFQKPKKLSFSGVDARKQNDGEEKNRVSSAVLSLTEAGSCKPESASLTQTRTLTSGPLSS
uniref:endothelin-converting enzyme 1 n=1 Tax=Fundulus heteroclitus TaxID=8078 RepID=A0A3Q2QZJ8_FUNHE